MWQWSNYLHTLAAGGGSGVLHVNLDETHIVVRPQPLLGNAVSLTRRRGGRRVRPERNATTAEQRLGFTLVALICDDPRVQPLLPQVIICGQHSMTVRQYQGMLAECPANVYLLRTKKGWNSSQILARHVRILARAIHPAIAGRKVMLTMDCARLHLTPAVTRACADSGVYYHLVPAKMTWLLQPCDTHAFARFKRAMRSLTEKAASLAVAGRVDIVACVRCVLAAILHVLQGTVWRRAFEEVGLCGSQDALGRAVACRLQFARDVAFGNTQPSADALRCVFPRRCVVRYTALWPRSLPPPAPGGPSPPPPSPSQPSTPPAPSSPAAPVWLGRTRSTSALADAAAQPEHHPSARSSTDPPAAAAPGSSDPWRPPPAPPAPAVVRRRWSRQTTEEWQQTPPM